MDNGSTLSVLIAAVILERPMCLVCLAAKVGATQIDTLRAIDRIQLTVAIATEQSGRCRACGSTIGPVYSLVRSG